VPFNLKEQSKGAVKDLFYPPKSLWSIVMVSLFDEFFLTPASYFDVASFGKSPVPLDADRKSQLRAQKQQSIFL
jgi:hypothetical protein